MSKRDRQGVRTPADLERKWKLDFISQMESDSREQRELIDSQNRTMGELVGKTSGTITSLEKDVSRAKKDISNLKLNVTSISIRLSNIEQEDKVTSQSISGLAQRVSQAEDSLTLLSMRLESALADLFARVAALESTTESGG
jgi:predicted  nucleic acid-binding Zn-ribbon protein